MSFPITGPVALQIFVSEFLTSGACPDDRIDRSMLIEGRAMLLGFLTDVGAIAGCRAVTTWNARLGPFPLKGVLADVVDAPAQADERFRVRAGQSDLTYVIAPESDGILARRYDRVAQAGGNWCGPDRACIEFCADKLATADLEATNFETIPTRLLQEQDTAEAAFPCVVKPRFGAGSNETFLVRNSSQLDRLRQCRGHRIESGEFVIQPFIAGISCSFALVGTGKSKPEVWPLCRQQLTADGRFRYSGGRVPAGAGVRPPNRLHGIGEQLAEHMPLRGYIGVDVIFAQNDWQRPVLVEINPRLTTSYLGYRQLTSENPAARVLASACPELRTVQCSVRWRSDVEVRFGADGIIRRRHRQ